MRERTRRQRAARAWLVLGLVAAASAFDASAQSQEFPVRPVRIVLERMDAVHRDPPSDDRPPSRRPGRCHVDTASFRPRAIEMAVACFGADRVLLGPDCPIFDTGRMLSALADVRFDQSTRKLILAGNARRIFFERQGLVRRS